MNLFWMIFLLICCSGLRVCVFNLLNFPYVLVKLKITIFK